MSGASVGPFQFHLSVGDVQVHGFEHDGERVVVLRDDVGHPLLVLPAAAARNVGIALQAVAVCTDQSGRGT